MRCYWTGFRCRGIGPLADRGLRRGARRLVARELGGGNGVYVGCAKGVSLSRIGCRIGSWLGNRLLVEAGRLSDRRLGSRRFVRLRGQPVPAPACERSRRRAYLGRIGPVRHGCARIPSEASGINRTGGIRLRVGLRRASGSRWSAGRGRAVGSGRHGEPTLPRMRAGGGRFRDAVIRWPGMRQRSVIGFGRTVGRCGGLLRRGRKSRVRPTLLRRTVTEPGWRAVRAARRQAVLVSSRCG